MLLMWVVFGIVAFNPCRSFPSIRSVPREELSRARTSIIDSCDFLARLSCNGALSSFDLLAWPLRLFYCSATVERASIAPLNFQLLRS